MTVLTPTCITLALQPMERLAGTATAVIGMVSFGGAALLAALIDRLIVDSVTPMALGFLAYGTLCAMAVRWAARAEVSPVTTPG